jgi:hypothetical protein
MKMKSRTAASKRLMVPFGVLGQHADQRQEQDRERLRDVALGELAGPREQEGSAQDRDAGGQRHHLGGKLEAGEVVQPDPRQRQRPGEREGEQIALARAGIGLLLHQGSRAPNSRSKRAFSSESPTRVFWVPSTST